MSKTELYPKEYIQSKTILALNTLIDLSCVETYPDREHDQTAALCELLLKAEQGQAVSLNDIVKALSN